MSSFASVKRAAIVAALGVTAITQLAPLSVGAADKVTLTGAGSTFDAPLFTKAFSEYTKSVNPNVQVNNYGGGGSGAGISQLTDKTVDFGATDGPMTDEQLTKAGGPSAVLHIPVTLGAVAVIYNISGLSAPLHLDGDTLASIFQGTITKWNDDKNRSAQHRCDLAEHGHCGGPSIGRLRHDEHLHHVSLLHQFRLEGEARRRELDQLARRNWR